MWVWSLCRVQFRINPSLSSLHLSGFPLTSLDLTDYLQVTDLGVACLTPMTSLTSLSLSRTKLTDRGMPYLEGS